MLLWFSLCKELLLEQFIVTSSDGLGVQALWREVGQMYSRWLVICKSVQGPAIGICTAGNELFQPRRKTMATICCSSQPLNQARKCRTMVQLRCFPMAFQTYLPESPESPDWSLLTRVSVAVPRWPCGGLDLLAIFALCPRWFLASCHGGPLGHGRHPSDTCLGWLRTAVGIWWKAFKLPSLGPTLPPPNAWVLIELLCTDDKFRGRGVGKLLLVPWIWLDRWSCQTWEPKWKPLTLLDLSHNDHCVRMHPSLVVCHQGGRTCVLCSEGLKIQTSKGFGTAWGCLSWQWDDMHVPSSLGKTHLAGIEHSGAYRSQELKSWAVSRALGSK